MVLLCCPANATQNPCGAGWLFVRSKCYKVYTSLSSWFQANATCTAQKGYIITIETTPENQMVVSLISQRVNSTKFWIGLNDIAAEGSFVWSSGYSFSDVGYGTLTQAAVWNDCVHGVTGATGQWYDRLCSSSWAVPTFVCEHGELRHDMPASFDSADFEMCCA